MHWQYTPLSGKIWLKRFYKRGLQCTIEILLTVQNCPIFCPCTRTCFFFKFLLQEIDWYANGNVKTSTNLIFLFKVIFLEDVTILLWILMFLHRFMNLSSVQTWMNSFFFFRYTYPILPFKCLSIQIHMHLIGGGWGFANLPKSYCGC